MCTKYVNFCVSIMLCIILVKAKMQEESLELSATLKFYMCIPANTASFSPQFT